MQPHFFVSVSGQDQSFDLSGFVSHSLFVFGKQKKAAPGATSKISLDFSLHICYYDCIKCVQCISFRRFGPGVKSPARFVHCAFFLLYIIICRINAFVKQNRAFLFCLTKVAQI